LDKEKSIKIKDWGQLIDARFIERPNRFVVMARLSSGDVVRAFLPNPGRLHELLFPGSPLLLMPNSDPDRSTSHTVMSVEREGKPVFLHTHYTNNVAGTLIERGLVPGLNGATITRSEVPLGRSRFDFLLEKDGSPLYLEVKSCTLFGNRVAMFPDAVTERGRRHLIELAGLSENGVQAAVMFVVHTPEVDWFMPDYHTDLAFSRTFLDVKDRVPVIPLSVEWTAELKLRQRVRRLEVPWGHIETEAKDRGAYLLLVRVDRDRRVTVGRLGSLTFKAGWHVYVGSAMKALSARIERHKRRRKKMHWHVDWLRDVADRVEALPIRTSKRIECGLSRDMAGLFDRGPIGFGSSDCGCDAHLFFSRTDPLDAPAFHDVLQKYRMGRPDY